MLAKVFLILILVLSISSVFGIDETEKQLSSDNFLSYNNAYIEGIKQAEKAQKPNYGMECFLAGFAFGPLGAVAVGASADGVHPETIPDNIDPVGYTAGYYETMKAINRSRAWKNGIGGSIAGTIAVLLIMYNF